MEITIRTIGNSKGVVLPKPLLAQAGLDGQKTAYIVVQNDTIILSKPITKTLRAGWAEAAAVLSAKGDDALLMGEFANMEDTRLAW